MKDFEITYTRWNGNKNSRVMVGVLSDSNVAEKLVASKNNVHIFEVVKGQKNSKHSVLAHRLEVELIKRIAYWAGRIEDTGNEKINRERVLHIAQLTAVIDATNEECYEFYEAKKG